MNSRFADDSRKWRRLCRAAVLEQDADKLSQIVRRMNSALEERRRMLRDLAEAKQDTVSTMSSMSDQAA
jgi:hypothetical protein